MKVFKVLIFSLLVMLICSQAFSQGTGFELLTTGPNSEALGLNEATSASQLGASNIYTNPANLAFETTSGFNADYSLWIGGLTNTHAAVNFKKDNSAIAFGLLASGADDFELRNRPGPSQGSFSVSYLSLSGAYAFSYQNLSLGAAFHYLREELYIYNASGYALNAGLSSHWLDKTLYVSAALQNLGKMDELNNDRTQLPANLRGGFKAKVFAIADDAKSFPLSVSLLSDIVVPLNEGNGSESNSTISQEKAYFNIALSIKAANIITVRGGYKTGSTARHLSFGTGVILNNITANYALIPFETGFGTVHSVGIGYRF